MPSVQLSRESLLPRLAAHVLEHGLGNVSLRPLARAAGTSDRMLIYHFSNKETLMADLLGYIARTYAETLDAALAGERPVTRGQVVARILKHARSEATQPFTALWWEIVAGAARGEPSYRAAAQAMMAELLGWLEEQMPADDPDPQGGARYLLTLIEGTLMLAAVGHADTAQQGLLASGLSRP